MKVVKPGKYAVKPAMNAVEFTVNRVVPNPFTPNNDGVNDMVNFYYDNPAGDEVQIKIYSLTGSCVKEITASAGVVPYWDGSNSSNSKVEGGVYIYQILAGEKRKNGTVILAK
jgi:gliding motility-associated-like protein